MATLDDVQQVMAEVANLAVYPNGAPPSIINKPIHIFPGQPIKKNVDVGLAAGESFIYAYTMNNMWRSTTRLPAGFVDPLIDAATIFMTVFNNTITLTGTVTPGQACIIKINNVPFSYILVAGDTLDTVAANLATLAQSKGASAVNNVITVTGSPKLDVAISTQATAYRILGSQERVFKVTILATSQEDRAALGEAIQVAFESLDTVYPGGPRYYLPMPDRTFACIRQSGDSDINSFQLDLAYQRDYLYKVEYHTTQTRTFHTVADVELLITSE